MNLKFPIHFQARISERDLSIDHVKKAIREPDFTETSFQGRIRALKRIDEKTIVVIYFKNQVTEEYSIITAYYL